MILDEDYFQTAPIFQSGSRYILTGLFSLSQCKEASLEYLLQGGTSGKETGKLRALSPLVRLLVMAVVTLLQRTSKEI